MPLRLVQRRTIWFPTLTGWLLIAFVVCGPLAGWFVKGESFLAVTGRRPAEVLVVEGWIGAEGIRAADEEYRLGGYHAVVAAGGLSGERWSRKRWNYAMEAEEQLLLMGVPREQVLLASSREAEIQRTFEMAAAARRAIDAAGLHPTAINVLTRGAHARRSRLIFEKVFGPRTKVGVIAWKPPLFEQESWWESSERAEDMVKETVGYFFELFFSSGRRSNTVNRSEQRSADSLTAPAHLFLPRMRLNTVFRLGGAIRYVVGCELARATIAPASWQPTRYDSKTKTLRA